MGNEATLQSDKLIANVFNNYSSNIAENLSISIGQCLKEQT